MADPLSIVGSSASIFQAIIDLALKIKKGVQAFKHNKKDCQKMVELVTVVRSVAQDLQKATEGDGGGGTALDDALKGLRQALQGGWDFIVSYEKKNAFIRFMDADGISENLRRINQDISATLVTVVLANVTHNTFKLYDIKQSVAALRAEFAKILETVAARPEANLVNLHLQQEVARLVQSYSDSNGDDASTRETKKTDDVARYPTYTSSYANERASTTTTKSQTYRKTNLGELLRQSTVTYDQQRYGASGMINSYYSYIEPRWYWWSSSGWCGSSSSEPHDGRRYPQVNIVILTEASKKYALGQETLLTEPPPKNTVVIKDMKQWELHWDQAAPYKRLLVYEFYDKRSSTICSLYKAMENDLRRTYAPSTIPVCEKLAKQYKEAVFCKLDANNFEFLARLCGVEGAYPTFVLFMNCKQVGKVVGLKEDELERSIKRALQINDLYIE